MDPLSALSVAAAVVQFIDVGGKLVDTYFEVRSTAKGQPTQVVSLAASAASLSSAASTAKEKVERLGSTYPRHAESLLRLTAEIASVEEKVKAGMERLTVKPKKYLPTFASSAAVAVKTVWSQGELDLWKGQLDGLHDQVIMIVLMCVWDETKKSDNKTDNILQAAQRIEKAVEGRNDVPGSEPLQSANHARMYQAIWASTGLSDMSTNPANLPDGVQRTLAPDQNGPNAHDLVQRKILSSLSYADMNDRASGIKTAFPETFGWIFEENWHSFRRWLTSQANTVFWITGVPASGKSTLMKYVTEHPSLRSLLGRWATPAKLSIAKFYFWNPGSKVQKSRVGLLRSLLFQLLQDRPDLITAVARRRQLYFSIAGDKAEAPEWEWEELRQCLASLVYHLYAENLKIAMFIDGLDEYEDYAEDNLSSMQKTDEMVEFLLDLQKSYGIKLCVSSRPLNYFRDKFKTCPNLAMQQLTQPDIDHYIDVRLGSSEAIQEMRGVDQRAVEKLICDLKSKAQGVFLWVILVVEQLLLTCLDTPHISAVRTVFDSLPEDITKLYDAIQQQTSPEKQKEASKLYQLVMEWKRVQGGQMHATFLWLAGIYDIKQPEYPTKETEPHIAKVTQRLVDGHTRGILQVLTPSSERRATDSLQALPSPSRPATVDFLHKTAYEWIQKPDNWHRIIQAGPLHYQPMLAILAVLVNYIGSPTRSNDDLSCVEQVFWLATHIPNTAESRAQLVSIIDKLDTMKLTIDAFARNLADIRGQKEDGNTLIWAAACGCHAYVQGKMDLLNTALLTPGKRKRLSFLRQNTPPARVSLLEAAIFGFENAGLRMLNPWHATERLKTVKVLLQHGARIDKYTVKTLKEHDVKYTRLLLSLAKDRDILKNFDAKVEAVYPESDVSATLDDILQTRRLSNFQLH